jgi:hypothetical protein
MEWVPDWWWQHGGISFKTDWGTITKTTRAYNSQIINGRMSDEGLLHHTIAFTPDVIQNEPNHKTRKAMWDIYGGVPFFRHTKALLIDESNYGQLWRVVLYKTIDDPLWWDLRDYGNQSSNPDVYNVFQIGGRAYECTQLNVFGYRTPLYSAREAFKFVFGDGAVPTKLFKPFEEMFL